MAVPLSECCESSINPVNLKVEFLLYPKEEWKILQILTSLRI
jgi:hypothetical protein